MNIEYLNPEHLLAGRRPTVLIADDIAASRTELAELVHSMGYRCILAASGSEVLQQVQRERPDLVLLDLLMPDMDGFDVTDRIRKMVLDRWLPLIVTSALQGDEHFIHALSRGADDYLSRPVNPALLEAKLHHYQRVLNLQHRAGVLARRQQAIHEHMAEAVITLDEQGLVCEFNRAAQQHFGRALLGKTLPQALRLDSVDLHTAHEIHCRDQRGEERSWALSASRWAMGAQRYTTVVLHDQSERLRVERMKDEFIATVSHELRTPLTSIIGALGLLASGSVGALAPEAQELAQMAQRNGTRLNNLINDILDLTKLEANRMVMQMRRTALPKLLAESLAANRGYAESYGVGLELQCEAAQAWALVDADRLMQVLANLLSNAIKHTRRHTPVALRLCPDPGGWRIEVQDQGAGIDPAFQARLFEKFVQADSSDRRELGGTGLGLYISKMLVERMGGHIVARSVPGQGSTFSVVLPAWAEHDQWILCLGKDRAQTDRVAQCVRPLGRVLQAASLVEAHDCVNRHGTPKVAVVVDGRGLDRPERVAQELQKWLPRDDLLWVVPAAGLAPATGPSDRPGTQVRAGDWERLQQQAQERWMHPGNGG